jgi:hypothetical protein
MIGGIMPRHFFNNKGLPFCCNSYDDGKDSVAGTSGNGGASVGSPSGVDRTTNGYDGGRNAAEAAANRTVTDWVSNNSWMCQMMPTVAKTQIDIRLGMELASYGYDFDPISQTATPFSYYSDFAASYLQNPNFQKSVFQSDDLPDFSQRLAEFDLEIGLSECTVIVFT